VAGRAANSPPVVENPEDVILPVPNEEPDEVQGDIPELDLMHLNYNALPEVRKSHLRNYGAWVHYGPTFPKKKAYVFGLHDYTARARVNATTGRVYHELVRYPDAPELRDGEKEHGKNMSEPEYFDFMYKAGSVCLMPFGQYPEYGPRSPWDLTPLDPRASPTARDNYEKDIREMQRHITKLRPPVAESAGRGDELDTSRMW